MSWAEKIIGWRQADRIARAGGRSDHLFYEHPRNKHNAVSACGLVIKDKADLIEPVGSDERPHFRCGNCNQTMMAYRYRKEKLQSKPKPIDTASASSVLDIDSIRRRIETKIEAIDVEIKRLERKAASLASAVVALEEAELEEED